MHYINRPIPQGTLDIICSVLLGTTRAISPGQSLSLSSPPGYCTSGSPSQHRSPVQGLDIPNRLPGFDLSHGTLPPIYNREGGHQPCPPAKSPSPGRVVMR